jgi:hypothetical protein
MAKSDPALTPLRLSRNAPTQYLPISDGWTERRAKTTKTHGGIVIIGSGEKINGANKRVSTSGERTKVMIAVVVG